MNLRFLRQAVMAFALLSAVPPMTVAQAATENRTIENLNERIAATIHTSELAKLYVARGDYFARTGDRESAIVDYTMALNLWPEDTTPKDKLAIAYFKRAAQQANLARQKEAIKDLDDAIRLWPEDVEPSLLANAYYNRALFRGKLMHHPMQKNIFEQEAEMDKETAYISNISDLDDALRLDPHNVLRIRARDVLVTEMQQRGEPVE